jgi:threonine/homoserine/homoserine lactone efflux protein
MQANTFLLYVGACVLLCIVPGPDMMFLLGRTIAYGRRAGLVSAVGITAGATTHLIAATLGLSAILSRSAVAFSAVKWVGAGYLIYLGVGALVSKTGPSHVDNGAMTERGTWMSFRQGYLSDLLNPKVALFYLAFIPQFVTSSGMRPSLQILVLGLTLNGIGIIVNCVIVAAAARITESMRANRRLGPWLARTMGAGMICLGVRFATDSA